MSSGKKTSITLIIIVSIISAMVGSFITAFILGDKLSSKSDGNKQDIVVNEGTKSENIYHAVTDKAMPSVVGITTTTIDTNNIFAIPQQSQGVGTGFIVDSKGYILTNSHVVSDGKASDVNVLFNDGSTSKGKVLWNDPTIDLAIVKVDKTGLPVADLGNSDSVRTGDLAVAIGNPLGLEFQKSVTQGIISGLDRSIQTEQSNMTGLIQTDASINPGNSGGPLLNDKGEVIGINTAKASGAEGLGFAIPINTAKPIVEQIIKDGKFEKVTLGIKGIDVKTFETTTGTDLAADEGVYIAEVVANTPAQKSGIQAGDVITKVGDTKITSMSDLNKALYKFSVGDKAKVEVNRGGKNITIDVKF
ncbi:serine protease HtrA [Paraclostridium bifermentans]|jgi:serine protease Do|uniref:Trypsin-like peptidase domain protein n=1 Tax=Paraclostridium bifermentans ATCC 638 = DSM 14991 TaxID=1233171 RepID=T4VIN3_PARBF|nr:trypsin-like peptidase domain-containing protein [Paraclostridium bifermentans]RDC49260.1 PDZ domain-containing protein [Acinetobacter sp. RIT592]EQK41358.1 trypsin-like peptidase domain protein [[Clostridium] bifermentans ATCC 638] [Paraclostridium bifermentans ATCC 638 = DSM 14991]MBS6507112.1 trypsin-like peptidase domain-containing protein [Paraclostridium bifermentans]MDU3335744.1 trypsin-like peptidase domain-containing protein [Paraclostridium bifermentans]MDU3802344.1 trypsin-like p